MSTRAQLRQRVRDSLGEPSTQYRFSDTALNNWINEGYRQYQMDLIENGEGYFSTTAFINLVANQSDYPLPSGWVKTEKVERVTSYGTIPLEKYERYEASNVTTSGNAGDWFLPTYRFRGSNLVLEPFPTFSQTNGLIHEYYALQPDLTADNLSPSASFIEPWQDMLVLYAIISALESKDAIGGVSDINSFRERLAEMTDKFKRVMNRRTQARDMVEPYGYRYDYEMGWYY